MLTSELKANARRALEGKWVKGALITLCYLLIMIVIEFVLGIIPVVGQIANIIISVPLTYGIIASFIKLKRGEEVAYTGFLKEGFSKFSKTWGIFGHTLLKMIVPIILIVVVMGINVYSTASAIMGGSVGTSIGMSLVSTVLIIVAVIYASVKALLYLMTNFILYDNPNMSSKEIVEESERLMKGNRWKYIWLELSFIGWLILSIFTLYIGLLWLVPYMEVAIICFYEALAGKASNQTEVVEEYNPISE